MTNNRRSLLKGMALGTTGASMPGVLAALTTAGAAQAQTAGGASNSEASAAWRELASAMLAVDDLYSRPPFAGRSAMEQAEAHVLMTQALETALAFWGSADTSSPVFSKFVSPARRVMGDNPDALYYFAPIRPDGAYVVRGNVAGATYTSFTIERADSDGGRVTGLAGTLNDSEFDVAPDGSFEIFIGGPKRDRNWIALTPDSRTITTRHYFERKVSVAADPALSIPMTIAPLTPPPLTGPPGPKEVAQSLRAVTSYFNAVMQISTPTDVPRDNAAYRSFVSDVPNVFPDPGQITNNRAIGYAAADNRYFMAEYRLGPDEALEMRGRFPKCRFANVVLFSRYLRSYDYPHRRVSLNRQQTVLEPDGSFRMILAHRDPGLPNWLDTEGRPSGNVFWRFLLPEGPIQPIRTRVVKFSDLRAG